MERWREEAMYVDFTEVTRLREQAYYTGLTRAESGYDYGVDDVQLRSQYQAKELTEPQRIRPCGQIQQGR
ncbi:hypothetical protein [Nocardia tengchongensis]|uniref:hypothetical protein n=1 Tax=Nocardia tengchongensis TaxID=2055889 RepID=UPI0036606FD5